jgi:hypothetical protein
MGVVHAEVGSRGTSSVGGSLCMLGVARPRRRGCAAAAYREQRPRVSE